MRAEEIRVVRGCDLSWDEMVGDERKRFCAACRRDVINLSALTEAEAIRVLDNVDGGTPACVRYVVDERGEVELRSAPRAPAPSLAGALLALVARHAPPLLPIVAAAGCATAGGVQVSAPRPAPAPSIASGPGFGTIVGRVIDENTGRPIPAVTVVVSRGGHEEEELTDANGGYTIPDLAPAADWVVQFVQSNGRVERRGVVVIAGGTTSVEAALPAASGGVQVVVGAAERGVDTARADQCTTVSPDLTRNTPVP